jgi:hypothetical protein
MKEIRKSQQKAQNAAKSSKMTRGAKKGSEEQEKLKIKTKTQNQHSH